MFSVPAGSLGPFSNVNITEQKVALISLQGLASSLQQTLPSILSSAAQKSNKNYFHVEAGITMADLQQLLDHQKPRLAVQATGGNPLSTLAGSISTATHGGEFQWPLLTDRVRAIYLVGPGGVEWWIEGTELIADQPSLQKIYPNLDAQHFIGGAWAGISGLTAQDVLNAVIVSMGTMEVIYSVVLEVVPQFGVQQIVTFTDWTNVLSAAFVTTSDLRSGDRAANLRVLNVLLDGSINGTGIQLADNVYADLAINPYTHECWITNRKLTPQIPIENNSAPSDIPTYISVISTALARNAKDTVENSQAFGRIFDFLNYATDVPSINISDDVNDLNQTVTLAHFVTQFPDVLGTALATISAQTVTNVKNDSQVDRGFAFIGDLLTGILHTIQGTTNLQYQFGNLQGNPPAFFWIANFAAGSPGNQILFYNAGGDGSWWLGLFNAGRLNWQLATMTDPSVLAVTHGASWTGNFNGGSNGDQILIHDPPSGKWSLGVFTNGQISWVPAGSDSTAPFKTPVEANGNFSFSPGSGAAEQLMVFENATGIWWIGTLTSGTLSWKSAGSVSSAPFFAGGLQNWWKVNLTDGTGADQILAYTSASGGNLWLGTLSGGSISWGQAQPAGPFNNLSSPTSRFWCGNFSGGSGGSQILALINGTNWSLGTFNNGTLTWGPISSKTPFKNFTGYSWPLKLSLTSSVDTLLIPDLSSGNWWLGTLAGSTLNWVSVASNSRAPFSAANNWEAWPGKFNNATVDTVLVYNPADGNWWLGTYGVGSLFWTQASNTTAGVNLNSNQTNVSHGVGNIGWPSGGIPGRGLEIALGPDVAFTFLQNVLFDNILAKNMLSPTNPQPLLGYISIRICPQTATLMGMQQYSPASVMIEIVSYRSPESNALMDTIQSDVLSMNAQNKSPASNAMLHWGLENDQMKAADLLNTPLNTPLHTGLTLTKLQAFKAVRQMFISGSLPIFDNNFTTRLGI